MGVLKHPEHPSGYASGVCVCYYCGLLHVGGDPPVQFNRAPRNQCSKQPQCGGCTDPFQPAVIEALNDTTFTVKIGPSGANRGYEAITGLLLDLCLRHLLTT